MVNINRLKGELEVAKNELNMQAQAQEQAREEAEPYERSSVTVNGIRMSYDQYEKYDKQKKG